METIILSEKDIIPKTVTRRSFDSPKDVFMKFLTYLKECDDPDTKLPFPNKAGFCRFCMISSTTYYKYSRAKDGEMDDAEDFREVFGLIEVTLEDITINTAISTNKPVFYIFGMKNWFNYVDKKEITKIDETINPDENKTVEEIEDEVGRLRRLAMQQTRRE